MEKKLRKVIYYIIPPILVLASIFSAFSNDVWGDEVYSIELCKHPFFEMLSIASLDVHPPLYYIALRLGIVLLGNFMDLIYVGKLVSIVPYIILLVIGYTYINKHYGESVAFFFNLFVVGMPKMLIYSTEIRMYSWGMLFVTCAFLQLPGIISDQKSKTNYVLLTIFSTMAAYTHYFACASAIVIYIEIFCIFLISKKYKEILNLILSGIGSFVMYIPWLFIFLQQTAVVVDDYWIDPPTIISVIKNFMFLFSANKVIDVLTLLIFAISLVGIAFSKEKIRKVAICGIVVWIGTIIFGVALSVILRPIFVSRYVMGSAACMWLGVSLGLSLINTDKLKKNGMVLLVLVSCFLVTANYVKDEMNSKYVFEKSIADVGDIINDETVIASDNMHVQRIVSYFYPQNYSIVYGESLSEITQLVYSDCNLGRTDDIHEITDGAKNIVLLNYKEETKASFEQEGFELEKVGEGKVSWYSFDMYSVRAK
ncbi:glycosyltransferase family 39 protein [Butyrivibrio sp. VCB2001]|uniref:glycosyltransferase family 39 protein n=1 Tax=Butyrivibrio sp. VCB2001 TaxID=1280667 RepID=UPI00041718BE|nr:hypothetical protein [Butyrivibrio sp. VCB2001]